MARAVTCHPDFQNYCILVTVNSDFLDELKIARCGALMPELIPRPAPEVGLSCYQGFFERFGIHVRNHQDFPRFGIRNDCRNQSVRIVFGGKAITGFDVCIVPGRHDNFPPWLKFKVWLAVKIDSASDYHIFKGVSANC